MGLGGEGHKSLRKQRRSAGRGEERESLRGESARIHGYSGSITISLDLCPHLKGQPICSSHSTYSDNS